MNLGITEREKMDLGTKVLVAGVGNLFFGDDGFGVQVAQRLLHRARPESLHVIDFGIRGFDFARALLEGYRGIILVDAVSRGGKPGDLHVLEEEASKVDVASGTPAPFGELDAHGTEPHKMIALASAMGKRTSTLRVVGCEPEFIGDAEDMRMELSAPVEGAIERAIELIYAVASELSETDHA